MRSGSARWLAPLAGVLGWLAPECALAAQQRILVPAPLPAALDTDPSTGGKALADLQATVDRGLAWLAAQQRPSGGWLADVGFKQGDAYVVELDTQALARLDRAHVGVSSLCGLAFLAGGNLPGRGRYGPNVRKVLDYVLAHTGENGLVSDADTVMYSHAFATLFLAQVHGMVREDRVRRGLERAVHIILDTQNAQGAWRYTPFTQEADISVTVCQLQALRAAHNVGIRVPRGAMDRAVEYVRASRVERGAWTGLFYYKIRGRGAYSKSRDYAINAAAVTSLFSAGVYEEPLYGRALRFLGDEYPSVREYYADHFYYWYGNYYAAQALHHAGGERWQQYRDRLTADLLALQQDDGRWINREGPGDAFATAVACLVLQIPFQYLPIFQR